MTVDPNLASYISGRRAQGASDITIGQELRSAGWDAVTVAEAVNQINPSVSNVPLLSSVRVVNQLESVPRRSHKWLWILIPLVLGVLIAGAWFAYGQYMRFVAVPVITDVATSSAPTIEQVADEAQREMLGAIAKAQQSDFNCADKQVTLEVIDNVSAKDATTVGYGLIRDDVVAEYAHACPTEMVPTATTSVPIITDAKKVY